MRTLRTVTLNTGYDDHFTVGDPVWGGVAPRASQNLTAARLP